MDVQQRLIQATREIEEILKFYGVVYRADQSEIFMVAKEDLHKWESWNEQQLERFKQAAAADPAQMELPLESDEPDEGDPIATRH